MSAAILNLSMEQGASFFRKLTFKDKDGNRIDLTGNSYSGQVRTATGQATTIASFTFVLADQTNPATKGDVDMKLSSIQTAGFPMKIQKNAERTTEKFAYDVEVTYPDSTKDRVLQGIIEMSPEVTV